MAVAVLLVLPAMPVQHTHAQSPDANKRIHTLGGPSAGWEIMPQTVLIGPNGMRLALVERKNAEMRVVVDGMPGPAFSAVGHNSRVFSPDGRRFAYTAQRGGKWHAVVDGQEGPAHDGIHSGPPVFSPDGARVAYVALQDGDWRVYCDGIEGLPFKSIAKGMPLFTGDSKRLIYAVQQGDRWGVYMDNAAKSPIFRNQAMVGDYEAVSQSSLEISAAGLWACKAERDGKRFVVIKGREGPQFEDIGPFVFSPDGARYAYAALDAGRWVIVIDGKKLKATFDGIAEESLAFSPCSKHIVFVAHQSNKAVALLDEKPGKEYDRIDTTGVVFSPDGRRLAYAALREGKWRLVLDGVEQGEYDGIAQGTITFSPDSKRVAYAARHGASPFVVIDGKEGTACSGVIRPVFSPDSRRVAHIEWTETSARLIVDGTPGKPMRDIVSPIFSPDSRHVTYWASALPAPDQDAEKPAAKPADAPSWRLWIDDTASIAGVDGLLQGAAPRFLSPNLATAIGLLEPKPTFVRIQVQAAAQNSAPSSRSLSATTDGSADLAK